MSRSVKAFALIIGVIGIYAVTARGVLAADYNHGDACTTSGAFHQTNDAGGLDFLICDGANWKSALFFSSSGNNLRLDNDPAAGSAGCIRYDSATSKLQFSDNCSTYSSFSSGGGGGLWSQGAGNDIYYNSGTPQVGIGLTNPAYSLDVTGSIRLTDQLLIGPTVGAATPTFFALNDLSDVDLTAGTGNNHVLTYISASGQWRAAAAGGGGTPAGATTQIQFNSGGAFGASANLVWNNTSVRLGIGDANPSVALDVVGDIDYTGFLTDVSDARLKENIKPLANALGGVRALKGVSFTMKDDTTGRVEYGLIAQDVEPVFPELVTTKADGLKTLNYIGMIAPLVEAVKEQQQIIDAQAATIQNLEGRLEALEARYGTGALKPDTTSGEQ